MKPENVGLTWIDLPTLSWKARRLGTSEEPPSLVGFGRRYELDYKPTCNEDVPNVPLDWCCPSCQRYAFECFLNTSVSKSDGSIWQGWRCVFTRHHDHSNRWSNGYKVTEPIHYYTQFANPRFSDEVICGQCNTIEGSLTRSFGLTDKWSFCANELSYVIDIDPFSKPERMSLDQKKRALRCLQHTLNIPDEDLDIEKYVSAEHKLRINPILVDHYVQNLAWEAAGFPSPSELSNSRYTPKYFEYMEQYPHLMAMYCSGATREHPSPEKIAELYELAKVVADEYAQRHPQRYFK